MGRKKEKKEPIVITRESLLYQPLSLAASGYEATSMQQDIIISILRKLRDALLQIRNSQFNADSREPRQLTLFSENTAVAKYMDKGEFRFDIHMSELGVQPKHYPVAFDQIYKASDIIVYVPDADDPEGKKMRRTKLFDTSDENVTTEIVDGKTFYKYKNRSPVTTVIISQPVMDFLFQTDSRIYDFVDDTAMMIKEKFSKRIYMHLATKKILGTYTVDYWKFRHDIGINDKDAPIDKETGKRKIIYPYFNDFVRRVLKPAEKTLKEMSDNNQCDYYFEYEPIYKHSKRAPQPDELFFKFHLSGLGNSIKSGKNIVRENIELERQMRDELQQSTPQIRTLMKRVTPENRAGFIAKVRQLIATKQGNERIQNLRAWANRSLTLYFDNFQPSNMELPFATGFQAENPTNTSIDTSGQQVPYLTDGAARWTQFLADMKERVGRQQFDVWFAPLGLHSFKDGQVTILIPGKNFYIQIENVFLEHVREALPKAFGEGVKLGYQLAEKK